MSKTVKVAIVKSHEGVNPIYSVVTGDVESLKYSPMVRIVEMQENDVNEYKKSLKVFCEKQGQLTKEFEKCEI